MTAPELRDAVLASITDIAPEVSASELDPAKPLREQVDLDSMAWLNVIIKVHERTGVEIPERDYARLVSLDDFEAYLLTTSSR